MKLERSRGTRDFLPEEQIRKQDMIATLRSIFERYGYSPLDSPALERLDVLSSKYAGGSEILKEIFTLKDQGERDLGLRYDLTVPFARIVGMNPQLKMPFKRYQIGEVWRDGPVANARYRQFTQCDVDVVGCGSLSADAELLCLATTAFAELKLDVRIKVNNRKLLNEVLSHFKVAEAKHMDAILSLDKLEKFGEAVVTKELEQKGLSDEQIEGVLDALTFVGSNDEKVSRLAGIVADSEGLKEVRQLLAYCDGWKTEVTFDPSLARGLSYYTGMICEVVLVKSGITSSICAGGRYDNMIAEFLGKDSFPAVGISFGLDRIYDAVMENEKSGRKTTATVYVIPIKTFEQSFLIAQELRSAGINVDIDLMNRGPSKNLQYANSLGIPYAVFIGEDEIKQGRVKLRNMQTGEEELLTVKECMKTLVSGQNPKK